MVITKMVLNLMQQNGCQSPQAVVTAFNANGIRRRCYELSKQVQGLHTDMALLSEKHFEPHERFFIPNYHFYRTNRFPGRKVIPHNM
jgi:hypothetical protein